MPYVETTTSDGVTVLAIARPPVNAIHLEVLADMTAAVEAAAASDARALVLTGSGASFSAGVDFKVVPAYDLARQRQMILGIDRLLHRFYSFPKPVVAAVNGHALGGGLVVALACDFRIATRMPCRLALAEVTAGIPFPAAAIEVVRAELPPPAARVLTLSGTVLAPVEAQALGIVDELSDAERLLDGARERALALATLASYRTVKAQLRAPTIARLAHIVATEDDPLLARGFAP